MSQGLPAGFCCCFFFFFLSPAKFQSSELNLGVFTGIFRNSADPVRWAAELAPSERALWPRTDVPNLAKCEILENLQLRFPRACWLLLPTLSGAEVSLPVPPQERLGEESGQRKKPLRTKNWSSEALQVQRKQFPSSAPFLQGLYLACSDETVQNLVLLF